MSTKSERKSLNRTARSVASASVRSILTSASRLSRKPKKKRGRRGRLSRQSFIDAGIQPPRSVGFSTTKRLVSRDVGGFQSRTPVPADTIFGMRHTEEMYKSRPFTHRTHGVGNAMACSGQLCGIGTNGVATNLDLYIPIDVSTLYNSNGSCGLKTADNTHVSGFLLHPAYMSQRLQQESSLYAKYRWRWLRITYQPIIGTNTTPGGLYIALLRNPTVLVESASVLTVFPLPQLLIDVIPNSFCSKFASTSVEVKRTEDILFNCDTFPEDTSTGYVTNNSDWISYVDERVALRLVCLQQGVNATALFSGYLMFDGEIEFYGPKPYNSISIGTTIHTGTGPQLESSSSGSLASGKLFHHDSQKWDFSHNLLPKQISRSSPPIIGGGDEDEKGLEPQTATRGLLCSKTSLLPKKHPLH